MMSKWKEPHFFAKDLKDPGFIQDESHYLKLFSGACGEVYLGEGSVWYLYSSVAAAEIHRFEPEARILIILRDPLDMMVSLHFHHVSSGYQHIKDFEKALEEQFRFSQKMEAPSFRDNINYLKVARYSEQLDRYLRIFSPKRILVLLFEDLVKDTAAIYHDVLSFLQINDNYQPDFHRYNNGKFVRSQRLTKLTRYLSVQGHNSSNSASFSARTSKGLCRIIHKLNTTPVTSEQRKISSALRRELVSTLRDDILRVEKMIHKDLSGWLSPKPCARSIEMHA